MSFFSKLFSNKEEPQILKDYRKDGVDIASIRVAQEVVNRLESESDALQFILEELDAASKGDYTSQEFARNSGFSKFEYEGAMKHMSEEGSSLDIAQQIMNTFSMYAMQINMDFATDLRQKTTNNIMKTYSLGKYT